MIRTAAATLIAGSILLCASMGTSQAQQIPGCIPTARSYVPATAPPAPQALNQGTQCNSCWAYATAAAFEWNHWFRFGTVANVSRSQILDCTGATETCTEGRISVALAKLVSPGTTDQASYRHTLDRKPCEVNLTATTPDLTPIHARTWSAVNANAANSIPTPAEIKAAICAHGAVVSGVVETQALFNHQGDAVIVENSNAPVHHAAVIIGWNDDLGPNGAWRVQYSRGTSWGTNGLGWIDYTSNKIGYLAAWVEADRAPPPPRLTPKPPVVTIR